MEAFPAKRRKGVYKFVINENVIYYKTPIKKEFENDWLEIKPSGDILIKGSNQNGYAWDGCSPKINIFDIFLVGTPDCRININTGKPVTYYASLIHDILYQFGSDIGIKRKEADRIFLQYLGDFDLRYIYYIAVRLLGWLFSKFD